MERWGRSWWADGRGAGVGCGGLGCEWRIVSEIVCCDPFATRVTTQYRDSSATLELRLKRQLSDTQYRYHDSKVTRDSSATLESMRLKKKKTYNITLESHETQVSAQYWFLEPHNTGWSLERLRFLGSRNLTQAEPFKYVASDAEWMGEWGLLIRRRRCVFVCV